MTKKQVRKLSLEHSNMALKDSNRVCLHTRTKHLQESSTTGYSGTGNESWETDRKESTASFHTSLLYEHAAYPEN